ncbi:MAG TPA: heparan-alpha-glucosaminide N-acetyltransferase domain-containing protein [Pyrinomonadaceae bacterium]|jgi:predicted acyltransferase|nr:heparan-alpha-glucosaminide N-acetyltransferase domain-containing protein [Pyrinomonadaceae bacterium]
MPNTTTTDASGRLVSLDVFRGITIAAMVLVNNPGSWEHIYWPLEHAQWHGWTPTDFVFPFFLFIVGVAITLAFGSRVESGRTSDLYLKIVKRTLIIFGIGLFLNALPYFSLSELRIPGVLQRIAVCYCFASLLFLNTKIRTQVGITIALLLGYWLLVKVIPAPGFAAGDLTKEGSLPSFIDRVVFGKHVWAQAKVYDPEGLLSTIPALATTLIGVLTGSWLRAKKSAHEKVAGLFVAGAICVAIGWAWNSFFPINKALWTSSYVLFTGGLALQFLALCYWVIDVKGYRRWAKAFEIFGLNAIALYVVADLIAVLLDLIRVSGSDGAKISLGSWIFGNLFAWASPVNASLAFAITFVLVCLGLMWILYRRKIFIKV